MELNERQKQYLKAKLERLANSKFRSSFKLTQKDFDYIDKHGMTVIEDHAYNFIRKRLAPSVITNDGKQTPMRGHPVFKAQHANATCCRGCLEKWHHIEKGRDLSEREIKFIVALIMSWISKQKGKLENEKIY